MMNPKWKEDLILTLGQQGYIGFDYDKDYFIVVIMAHNYETRIKGLPTLSVRKNLLIPCIYNQTEVMLQERYKVELRKNPSYGRFSGNITI